MKNEIDEIESIFKRLKALEKLVEDSILAMASTACNCDLLASEEHNVNCVYPEVSEALSLYEHIIRALDRTEELNNV